MAGIANSTEARELVIRNWYQTYLGRQAKDNEVSAGVMALASQIQEKVLSEITGSTEYFDDAQNRGFAGTPDQDFVKALYKDLLLRAPGKTELDSQVAELQLVGKQKLALSFLQSLEYRSDVVAAYYTTLLHRAASAAEIAGLVDTGLDLLTLRMGIESSLEFFVNG